MADERRRSVRARMRLVTFVKDPGTGKVRRVLTTNFSSVGVCFIDEQALQPGTKLELEIQLPEGNRPIACAAEVVWTRLVTQPRKSYERPIVEVGVRFTLIQPKDQALLKSYAALNAPPPSES